MKNIVSFDIDGVLNNYPDCWLSYLNKKSKKELKSISEAKIVLSKSEYDFIKYDYRMLGEISEFTKPNYEMIDVVNSYYNSGFQVVISTSRPINSPSFPLLFGLTEKWLRDQGICYTRLLFKDENLTNHMHFIDNILFHIDDELKYIRPFKDQGILAYLYKFCDEISSEITCKELVYNKIEK